MPICMEEKENNFEHENILSKLNLLEKRIILIESKVGINAVNSELLEEKEFVKDPIIKKEDNSLLESKIGGFGLALTGNIVLLFGIIFLKEYINNIGFPILSILFGYFSVGCFLFLSKYSEKIVSHLSQMFDIISQFLLFYFTLRLHFFSVNPFIANKIISTILVFIVIAYQIYLSIKNKSEFHAGIAILMAFSIGLINNSSHLILSISPLVAITTTYFFFKYRWNIILIISMFLVYLNLFIWYLIITNTTNDVHTIVNSDFSQYYLILTVAVFSIIAFVKNNETVPKGLVLSTILINAFNFSIVLLTYVTAFFKTDFTILFLLISSLCIVFSIVLKYRSEWKFTPALFVMYGFVAISISVYGIFSIPYTFLLLALQSLFVLVVALWYRSLIIVGINTFLFLMLLLTYFFNSGYYDSINFAFAGVALISANILNWERALLKIENELLPTIYMIVAFFAVLLALYNSISSQYITLSWVIASVIYFVYSILFKDAKYRWMSIFTLVAAALYLFLIDSSRISLAYRVIAFLFMAVISIVLSLYYSKSKKKIEQNEK